MAVVLVVNDDRDMLDAYEALLRRLGHEPVTKAIVDSGPAEVRKVKADALVVDLRRPDEDAYGLRLIEEVRADPKVGAIPILLCTGAVDEAVRLAPRLETLKVPILPKPFGAEELARNLASLLGRSGADSGSAAEG